MKRWNDRHHPRLKAKNLRSFVMEQLAEHKAVSTVDLLDRFRTKYGYPGYKAPSLLAVIAIMEREGRVKRAAHGVLVRATVDVDPDAVYKAKNPDDVRLLYSIYRRGLTLRVSDLQQYFGYDHYEKRCKAVIAKYLRRLEAAEYIRRPRFGHVCCTEKGEKLAATLEESIFA